MQKGGVAEPMLQHPFLYQRKWNSETVVQQRMSGNQQFQGGLEGPQPLHDKSAAATCAVRGCERPENMPVACFHRRTGRQALVVSPCRGLCNSPFFFFFLQVPPPGLAIFTDQHTPRVASFSNAREKVVCLLTMICSFSFSAASSQSCFRQARTISRCSRKVFSTRVSYRLPVI